MATDFVHGVLGILEERITYRVKVNSELIDTWGRPKFQRAVERRLNDRALQVIKEIKETDIIPGTLTLGTWPGVAANQICSGQQRINCFLESGLKEAYANICVKRYRSEEDAAWDYEREMISIVRPGPDTLLRSMALRHRELKKLREHCPFVGNHNGKNRKNALSLGLAVRCWLGSFRPAPARLSDSVEKLAKGLELNDPHCASLIHFMTLAHKAWRCDVENFKLWDAVNLATCMWVYRQLVLTRKLNANQFYQCLLALSADPDYTQFLIGRNVMEKARAPVYMRLSEIFTKRLVLDLGAGRSSKAVKQAQAVMPRPTWVPSTKVRSVAA